MLAFNFMNPTNILFGKGKTTTIKACIASEGRGRMDKKEKGVNHGSK